MKQSETDFNYAHALVELRESIIADPGKIAEEWFGVTIWGTEERGLKSFFNLPFRSNKFAVCSGHKVSKTHSVTMWPILWIFSHLPSYVIIVGSSWETLEQKIFPTLRAQAMMARAAWHKKIADVHGEKIAARHQLFDPIRQRIGATTWTLNDKIKVIAKSPQKEESIQSFHSEGKHGGLLLLVDEASHLEEAFFRSIESYADDPRNCIGLLGNPLEMDGPFANIARQEEEWTHEWELRTVSSEDTPNFIATEKAIRNGEMTFEQAYGSKTRKPREVIELVGLANWKFVKSEEKKYGRSDPEFQIRILGEVPDQSESTFIRRSLIYEAGKRECKADEQFDNQCIMTVDTAWSEQGDDAGIMKIDPVADCVREYHGFKGLIEEAFALEIRSATLNGWPVREIRIEMDGTGAPLFHLLRGDQIKHRRAWLEGLFEGGVSAEKYRADPKFWAWPCPPDEMPTVTGVMMGGRAHEDRAYINKKAESWYTMRDGLRTLAIPPKFVPMIMVASRLKYLRDGQHRLQIESKKDFKARGNKSPTGPDCLAMYYARPVGDPIFRSIIARLPRVQMRRQPTVYWTDRSRWMIHLDGQPVEYDRPGDLERAVWYDRRGESAVLLIHKDDDACRTVFGVYEFDQIHVTKLAERMAKNCLDHNEVPFKFKVDRIGAHEASERAGANVTYHDELYDALRPDLKIPEHKRKVLCHEIPDAIPISALSGTGGLETLDRWIENNNDENVKGKDLLYAWPRSVVDGLSKARFREPTRGKEGDELMTQSAVGLGGPLVICLRLIALEDW